MSSSFRYANKDKFVKIYRLVKKRSTIEGKSTVIVTKEYLHPQDQGIRAYIRQLSATERFESSAHQDSREYEVVINYRVGVTVDCYLEYRGMVLKVAGVDGYELKNAELKLRVHEQSPDEEAQETTGKDWDIQ